MLILTIRTDKPEAELGLYTDSQQLAYVTWHAHRELSETIHSQIRNLLESHKRMFSDIQGIVVYKGPGSFTGLRIGISVANAFAAALQAPLVGASGENWQLSGISRLQKGNNDRLVQPKYGSPPHITPPKK